MQFTGEEYYRAATERMRQAREIHDSAKNYALAIYCGGLAVECILRAYRWRKAPSFEGRHDLKELFDASGFLRTSKERARKQRMPAEEIERSATAIRQAMGEVAALWH